MEEKEKVGYQQLYVGLEFPPRSYKLEAGMVSDYLRAVGESNPIYQKEGLVPPLAITAFAMAALSEGLDMPPGTIHVSQELQFLFPAHSGDTITCFSKVSRKADRGGMHIMATDISVVNQQNAKVLTGRVGFVLPEII